MITNQQFSIPYLQPFLDHPPEEKYSFNSIEEFKIDLGQTVNLQNEDEVTIEADLGELKFLLELDGTVIKYIDD